MYFSAFHSASCAEHQCPLWEDHDSAAVSKAAVPSTSTHPLFLEELLENEIKCGARDRFTLSTSERHSWMPAALFGTCSRAWHYNLTGRVSWGQWNTCVCMVLTLDLPSERDIKHCSNTAVTFLVPWSGEGHEWGVTTWSTWGCQCCGQI